MNGEEFSGRVREEFPYAIKGDTEQLARTVPQALVHHVGEGE